MSKDTIVLRSFTELAQWLGVTPDETPRPDDDGPVDDELESGNADDEAAPDGTPDLATLLAELQAVQANLAGAAQEDATARTAARSQLDAYDQCCARLAEAEAAVTHAEELRANAEALAATAFTETARKTALDAARIAVKAAEAASRLVAVRQAEVTTSASSPVVQQLLADREREHTRQTAEAAEAERTRRLRDGLATVHAVLAAGRFAEAEAMLEPLAKDHPDSAEITSLQDSIRCRAQAVKVGAAEEALRAARRTYRQAPADALAQLEALDLQDLPRDLLHQIKGIWAAACARLCQMRGVSDPLLRYLPAPAHGVVVAREQEGCYRVVSALGARDWSPGSVIPEPFLRQARPLRASGR